jgi:hypothetical protein
MRRKASWSRLRGMIKYGIEVETIDSGTRLLSSNPAEQKRVRSTQKRSVVLPVGNAKRGTKVKERVREAFVEENGRRRRIHQQTARTK